MNGNPVLDSNGSVRKDLIRRTSDGGDPFKGSLFSVYGYVNDLLDEKECILQESLRCSVCNNEADKDQGRMQIQTILNRFEKYSSFVYGKCRLVEEGPTLEVEIKPRKNGKPVCSKCGQKGSISCVIN